MSMFIIRTGSDIPNFLNILNINDTAQVFASRTINIFILPKMNFLTVTSSTVVGGAATVV